MVSQAAVNSIEHMPRWTEAKRSGIVLTDTASILPSLSGIFRVQETVNIPLLAECRYSTSLLPEFLLVLASSNSRPDQESVMSKPVSEASEEFEFIETPAAPTPTPPAEHYGVKTTTVSMRLAMTP